MYYDHIHLIRLQLDRWATPAPLPRTAAGRARSADLQPDQPEDDSSGATRFPDRVDIMAKRA